MTKNEEKLVEAEHNHDQVMQSKEENEKIMNMNLKKVLPIFNICNKENQNNNNILSNNELNINSNSVPCPTQCNSVENLKSELPINDNTKTNLINQKDPAKLEENNEKIITNDSKKEKKVKMNKLKDKNQTNDELKNEIVIEYVKPNMFVKESTNESFESIKRELLLKTNNIKKILLQYNENYNNMMPSLLEKIGLYCSQNVNKIKNLAKFKSIF